MKGIELHQIAAEGPARLYTVEFHPGLNLICGPFFTGKTSVLELVDYCLGAKAPPAYPELSKCDHVWLDVSVNSQRFTIRRSLRSPGQKADIVEAPLEQARHSEVRFVVDVKHSHDESSISGYILARLGLLGLNAKRAPTKDASKTSSVSLRDLMFLCYVDQDRISNSKGAFLEDNPFKAIKWKAAFEILHGLHDEAATALANRIESTEVRIAAEQRRAASVERFLGDASVPFLESLDAELEALHAEETRLVAALDSRRRETQTALGSNLELVMRRDSDEDELRSVAIQLAELGRELSSLSRLRVQYQRELEQLEFIRQANLRVGSLPVIRCPACLQSIEVQRASSEGTCQVCHQIMPLDDDGEISVDRRIQAVRSRIRDLDGFIIERKSDSDTLAKSRTQIEARLHEVTRALSQVRIAALLPLNRAVLDSSEALAIVRQTLTGVARNRQLRAKLGDILLNISKLQYELETLRAQSAAVPDPVERNKQVVGMLAESFRRTLDAIRFPARRDAGIDAETYLPVIRGAPYGKLSSKGAISLAVSAWHIALLEVALDDESCHPRLLMLDSPLNHVGRAAEDPEFRDQRIVDDFYCELRRLHAAASPQFQLIMVDNRPPGDYASFAAATFTGDPSVGRFGFIDDEVPDQPPSGVDEE